MCITVQKPVKAELHINNHIVPAEQNPATLLGSEGFFRRLKKYISKTD